MFDYCSLLSSGEVQHPSCKTRYGTVAGPSRAGSAGKASTISLDPGKRHSRLWLRCQGRSVPRRWARKTLGNQRGPASCRPGRRPCSTAQGLKASNKLPYMSGAAVQLEVSSVLCRPALRRCTLDTIEQSPSTGRSFFAAKEHGSGLLARDSVD